MHFSCCVLFKMNNRRTDQKPLTSVQNSAEINSPGAWPKMAKTAKNHGTASDFITVNPPFILAPTPPHHFHNIQTTPLHVMPCWCNVLPFRQQFFAPAIAAPPPLQRNTNQRPDIVFRPVAYRNCLWFLMVSVFV